MIEAILAVFQSLVTMPLWIYLQYVFSGIGAILWLNSFNTVAGSESGPAALSGLMFCNIFSTDRQTDRQIALFHQYIIQYGEVDSF